MRNRKSKKNEFLDDLIEGLIVVNLSLVVAGMWVAVLFLN